jgi:NitT/TauT family transport system ATP-binding protein
VVAAAARAAAPPRATIAPSAIDIRGVSHHFELHGAILPVLDDINLHIEPGSFVALLGPSGCGKSTLLRLVAGLEQPRAGQILDDGEPVAAPDPSRVVMFQDPTLYPWRTVRANAALGLEARGELRRYGARVDDALGLVGLRGFETAYPHQISGGMAQRVSLARALVNEPLLVLDEPLGKLDSLTRLGLQRELVQLWQQRGFTVLMVTHDVEEALLMATRGIVLSERPARITADVAVDKPYPRHRDDPDIASRRASILALLGIET